MLKLIFMRDLFDKLSLYYDHMVNWPERFAREGPFFLKIFRENNVKSMLDCACGTGKHVLYFMGKSCGALNILTIARQEKGWQMETQSKKLSLFNKKDIKEALQSACFKKWKLYGDYKFAPYSEEDSIDIIGVAKK